jgi:hypothetical protein
VIVTLAFGFAFEADPDEGELPPAHPAKQTATMPIDAAASSSRDRGFLIESPPFML